MLLGLFQTWLAPTVRWAKRNECICFEGDFEQISSKLTFAADASTGLDLKKILT